MPNIHLHNRCMVNGITDAAQSMHMCACATLHSRKGTSPDMIEFEASAAHDRQRLASSQLDQQTTVSVPAQGTTG
jgi:hypothetical protein